MPNYKKIAKELNKAYKASDTTEKYLKEIMKIYAKHGLIKGEWSCSIGKQ